MAYEKWICSLVGAGGKTTLMYDIAKEHADKGRKVIVTTSVPVFSPDQSKMNLYYAANYQEVDALWAKGSYAIVGNRHPDGSVDALSSDAFRRLSDAADLVIIEADDARQMSCKVPGDGEPVIYPECNVVIGVFGMKAFGHTLQNACLGSSAAARHLNVSEDHLISCDDIADIVSSDWGNHKNVDDRKYFIVLNQCDGIIELKAAMKVSDILKKRGFHDVFMSRRGRHIDEQGNETSVETFFNAQTSAETFFNAQS